MRDDLSIHALDHWLIAAKLQILANVVQEKIDRRLLRSKWIGRTVKDDLRRFQRILPASGQNGSQCLAQVVNHAGGRLDSPKFLEDRHSIAARSGRESFSFADMPEVDLIPRAPRLKSLP